MQEMTFDKDTVETATKVVVSPKKVSDAAKELRVIVLDDNEFDRTRVQRLLDKIDTPLKATFATSLVEFEQAIDKGSFELALVDYSLPVGNGLEALKALRARPHASDTRTIMIAGEGKTEIAVSAIKQGCDDYIIKDNLTPEALRVAIDEALRDEGSPDEARSNQVDSVMRAINDVAINRLRPLTLRMMRHLRQLRITDTADAQDYYMHTVNENCRQIFDFCESFSDEVSARAETLH